MILGAGKDKVMVNYVTKKLCKKTQQLTKLRE